MDKYINRIIRNFVSNPVKLLRKVDGVYYGENLVTHEEEHFTERQVENSL